MKSAPRRAGRSSRQARQPRIAQSKDNGSLASRNPLSFVPRRMFLTRGVGRHREKLTSFEMALRDAGIAEFNLVTVSSIFPPGARIIPKSQGFKEMVPGQIVFCVLSRAETNEPNRLMASSIGVACPRDASRHGYISEHHCYGETDRQAGDYAEDLAAGMLATVLGIPFDLDKAYDERKEQYKIGGQIVRTRNITQSAVGSRNGDWTTVVTTGVFLPD